MIIVTTHATVVNGKIYEAPSNILAENLIKEGKDFLFIRHYMNGEKRSEIHTYARGIKKGEKELFIISNFTILRYITEILSSFFYILFSSYTNIIYIGVDPLNSFTGFLLKKIKRVKKNIFYTPDYSPQRFGNKILNKIYHGIDKICVFGSDEVWNVSSRIYEIRKNMGLSDIKNIFIPNVPGNIPENLLKNQKNKFHLITLGIISEQLDFIGIFECIQILRTKYPDLLLKIIGNGPKEEEYKELVKKIGIQDNVVFLGYMDHKNALEEISKSGVGLALYNGKWGFNYYGDSMKCREYFAFGLPVLTTNTHSTTIDIQENSTGIVSEMNSESYIIALENLFNNYENYSEDSYKLGKKYSYFYLQKIQNLC